MKKSALVLFLLSIGSLSQKGEKDMTQALNEVSWQEPIDLILKPSNPALFLESSDSEEDLTVVEAASLRVSKFYESSLLSPQSFTSPKC